MEQLLTVEQTAEFLQINKVTLYKHLKDGKIAGALKIGGSWRVSKPHLEREIEKELAASV